MRHVMYEARQACGRESAVIKVNGVRLIVDIRCECVGRVLYLDRNYEPAETNFLTHIIQPGMTVCDVGANLGYFTTLSSKLVGRHGCVLAVEPDSRNFSLLQQNIALNRTANVHAAHLALGSETSSEGELFHSATNWGDHRLYDPTHCRESTEKVSITTLDQLAESLNLPLIDVIKIDVQGFERRVQLGMLETMRRATRQLILTEFWPHGICAAGDAPDAYFETFIEEGYEAFRLESNGKTAPTTREEVMQHLSRIDEDDARYANLVFVKGTSL